jgi:hypothetical protein
LAAAGLHPGRHLALRNALFPHRGGKLLGDDLFDGVIFARLQNPLAGEEFVEGFLTDTGLLLFFAFIMSPLVCA